MFKKECCSSNVRIRLRIPSSRKSNRVITIGQRTQTRKTSTSHKLPSQNVKRKESVQSQEQEGTSKEQGNHGNHGNQGNQGNQGNHGNIYPEVKVTNLGNLDLRMDESE